MNRLPAAKRAQILTMMVEGVSIRAISRTTGASKNTIAKLLADAGQACSEYQDRKFHGLPCKRVQVDEIWAFAGMKRKNVPEEKKGELDVGDYWTWTSICAETKIVPAWFVGHRDVEHARTFMLYLASRMAGHIQLTSDGLRPYQDTVSDTFAGEVDYAMLVKQYGHPPSNAPEKRYSPAACVGVAKQIVTGNPDKKHISTSYIERQNLNISMGLRRFARLTNAFSKKMENHVHALSIYFMHYNFCRIHPTLHVSPAMAARVSQDLWSMGDVIAMIEK